MCISTSTPRVNNRSKKISENRERTAWKFVLQEIPYNQHCMQRVFCHSMQYYFSAALQWTSCWLVGLKCSFFYFSKKKSRFRSQIQVKLGQWQKSFGRRPCTCILHWYNFYFCFKSNLSGRKWISSSMKCWFPHDMRAFSPSARPLSSLCDMKSSREIPTYEIWSRAQTHTFSSVY